MGKWKIPPDGGHLDLATGIYFQNMTGREIEQRIEKNDLIIIPVGSTENHGPHACAGEDTFLLTRIAEQVALATGCTVAQPVWYGSHPFNHLGMPGTIVVPEEDLAAYLRAIIAGFWNAGFRKQIFINGHAQDYVIPMAIHQFGKKYQVPAVIAYLNWWFSIRPHIRDKAHGGPFETPFVHADECETSFSLALFPEMIKMEDAVDTKGEMYIKEGIIDKSGLAYGYPMRFYDHMGLTGMEVLCTPEGVVGKSTLASADKAKPGVEAAMDYLEDLVNEIMIKFPAGKLPPIEKMTQRPKEQIESVIKGPRKGGAHIYTISYPT